MHLVDHDTDVHQIVRDVLGRSGYEVLCHADPRKFLDEFRPRHPQCLILEVFLPFMSGLELQRRLLDQQPGLSVILITRGASPQTVIQALRQGARDFLEKPWRPEELLDSVGRALERDGRRSLAQEKSAHATEKIANLSAREREIFLLIAGGHSSKSAAGLLLVSKRTIDFHRGNLMRKLGAGSVAELVRLALKADATLTAGRER